MYTVQHIGSLVGSLGVGYLCFASGYNGIAVIAAAVLTYFIVRWSWASYHRTRYWLSRGTKGVHTEYCPNCERDRHRTSGDWILKCHECGWKPGIPVLRWAVRSVPVIQFRRSISRVGAFAAGVSITTMLFSQTKSTAPTFPLFPPSSPAVPNLPSYQQVALFGVVILLMVGAILWMMRPRQYYCRNCGQDLGRDEQPDMCPKCGSNRFTEEDPGVGEKVRVEQVE